MEDQVQQRSTFQMMVIGVIILIVGFLIIGTFTTSNGEPTGFGIARQPFVVLAILALIAGLLSFLSPCTMPILTAYFAFAFQSGRKQIAANTFVFMVGLASMFSLLGAGASALGSVLQQNQQLLILLGGSFILIFGVMNLVGKGFTGLQTQSESGEPPTATLGGSFIFGVTFAAGWSGCIGPILGAVLGLAATSGSVLEGTMLLFIYAMGLGLPLILIATLFGRIPRDHVVWRALRGKGWTVDIYTVLLGLLWTLAIWRILVAAVEYAFFFILTPPRPLETWQEWGLLFVAAVGVGLWLYTSPQSRSKRTVLNLHSTQLISGALFIILGLFMLNGTLASLNSIFTEIEWVDDLRYTLVEYFSQ
jgi:cytochrome c-type biogenesis protein